MLLGNKESILSERPIGEPFKLMNGGGNVLSYGGGGGEEPKPKNLSHAQINMWSDFVEKNKGVKDFNQLYNLFSKQYPKSGISKQILSKDLDLLNRQVQQEAKKDNSPLYTTTNTGYSFPRVTYNGKDMGRMNAMMQSEIPIPETKNSYPEKLVEKRIPRGVKNFWFDEQRGLAAYEDPQDGIIKFAQKSALHTPEMRQQSVINELNKK